MPKVGQSTPGSHELRACTECRKRKSKCSGCSPCNYCATANKPCIYGVAPSRTPLTRKNLDAAEARCSALTSIISKIKPDLDIEIALIGGTRELEKCSTESLEAPDAPRESNSDEESTVLPDKFEWRETPLTSPPGPQEVQPDGMASLPTGRMESGYLGTSSGTSLLRTISDLIPESTDSQNDQQNNASPANTNSTCSPGLSMNLGNAATLDNLIDAYFMWYNPSYPILHEKTFREKYQSRHQIHSRSSWHPIFFLVLAIGDWILAGSAETEQSRYYTAARSRMSMRMLESGTMLNVQAFLLMGNYLQKRDRPNTGYNFIGIAYRMALGLGLHREPPGAASTDTLYNERRRVVWWIAYCFDSGLSLTTGRPLNVSDSFIETRLPRNIDDSACTLEATLPPILEQPTVYSAIIAQTRLVSIGNVVFSELISSTDQNAWDLKVSRSIDYQFKTWKLSLPAYFTALDIPSWFRGPRAIVMWKEQNLRMMLWWASQRKCDQDSDREEAQNMCHFTAVETIQEIANFCQNNQDIFHIGLSWYATYFLFQATVILSIDYLRPTQRPDPSLKRITEDLWLPSISRSRDCLAFLGHQNKAAMRCLAVLDRIRDRSQPSQAITPSGPNRCPDSSQLQSATGNSDDNIASLAIDPTLQMLFEDSQWGNNLFEGLTGFPSTGEVEPFDYIPANSVGSWTGATDQGYSN